MRLSLTKTDSSGAIGCLSLNKSGQLTSAAVLWSGPEGRSG